MSRSVSTSGGTATALARGLQAAVLAALLAGCASSGRTDAGSWFEARGADFMDMFGVRVGVGVGLGAYARCTEYLQLGFMFRGPADSNLVVSSETPHTEDFRMRAVPCVIAGNIGRYGGVWFDSTREVMLPLYSTRDDEISPIRREVVVGVVPLDGRADLWRYEFGAGLHLLLIGAAAEVRPAQMFDFLAGIVGYDPAGDDVPVVTGPESEEAEPAS